MGTWVVFQFMFSRSCSFRGCSPRLSAVGRRVRLADEIWLNEHELFSVVVLEGRRNSPRLLLRFGVAADVEVDAPRLERLEVLAAVGGRKRDVVAARPRL